MNDREKEYLYSNILLAGPNKSYRKIVWTNRFCGIALALAVLAAIWL